MYEVEGFIWAGSFGKFVCCFDPWQWDHMVSRKQKGEKRPESLVSSKTIQKPHQVPSLPYDASLGTKPPVPGPLGDIVDCNGTFIKLQKTFLHALWVHWRKCHYAQCIKEEASLPHSNPSMLCPGKVLFYTEAKMTNCCLSCRWILVGVAHRQNTLIMYKVKAQTTDSNCPSSSL